MGKRKRKVSHGDDHPSIPPPSDSAPCSLGRDLMSTEDMMDSSMKQQNPQLALGRHNFNLSRALFLKRSRQYYGNHYSRRNSSNYCRASTSTSKSSPSLDERLNVKMGSRFISESGHRAAESESREKVICRPERIRTSSSLAHTVSHDAAKMVCTICENSLRRKPRHFVSSLAPEELSIVGVLTCGHIFHADCLEQRTHVEDIRDPPCPLCLGMLSKAEAA